VSTAPTSLIGSSASPLVSPSVSPFALRDYVAALAVIVLWGFNFVAMKFALRDFTPYQLGAARYVFALLPLIFFIPKPAVAWRYLVLYGLCQGVGQFGFLFTALNVGMTASLASVLMQTQVFFTAIFSFFLLRERPSKALQGGLALAAGALLCFAWAVVDGGRPQVAATIAVTAAGLLLNLCAAAMWAASNIVARKTQQATAAHGGYDAMGFVVWSSLMPVLPFCALAVMFDAPERRWQWLDAAAGSWLAVAYLGWMATLLAYTLWTGLLNRHPANRVSPFSLGVPVVGLATGMLALGEVITAWQWAGIGLVMAALVCVLGAGQR
jgi:O-acetylserine/cysteine efflux transporter